MKGRLRGGLVLAADGHVAHVLPAHEWAVREEIAMLRLRDVSGRPLAHVLAAVHAADAVPAPGVHEARLGQVGRTHDGRLGPVGECPQTSLFPLEHSKSTRVEIEQLIRTHSGVVFSFRSIIHVMLINCSLGAGII
jgi:hypothetical protein